MAAFLERRRIWAVVILIALSFGSYLGTLDAGFVWDDVPLLARLSETGREGGVLSLFAEEFGVRSPIGYYRPVVMLSLLFDRAVFGENASFFHLTNVAFHCATTLLFLSLAHLWTGGWFLSFAAAAVFAVHPVHVESVAFISARSDLLAALFLTASSVFWISSSRRTRPWPLFAASSMCWLVSLLCKETSIVLPVALLFFAGPELFPGLRNRFLKKTANVALFGAGGLLIYSFLRFGAAGAGFGSLGKGAGIAPNGYGALVVTAIEKIYLYLKLLVFPFPSRSWYSQSILASNFSVLGGILILAGIALVLYHGKGGFLSGAVVWTVVFLAPVAGWIPISGSVAAERFLYIPSMGFCLLTGALFMVAFERWRAISAVSLCCLLAVFSVKTAARARIWDNEYTLVQDMVRSAPDSALGWGNLGYLQLNKGQAEEAVKSLNKALSINPLLARSHLHLGLSFFELSDWPNAIRHLIFAGQSRDLGPAERHSLNRALGIAQSRAGQCDKAMESLSAALELSPGDQELIECRRECEAAVKSRSLSP